MGIVSDLKDEFTGLANIRMPWEKYWREIAMYVLPHTQHFDKLLQTDMDAAISTVVSMPAASRRSKDLYDMTSIWAIERLTAGMISLKTPESQFWQDLGTDDLFGEEPSHEEALALERLRNYLFKIRGTPRSGFWPAHRAAIRSMCGFGDGWMFIEEVDGQQARQPFRYQYQPLPELYPGVDTNGQPNRMFRVFKYTMEQAVRKFGPDKVPPVVLRNAQDPQQKHHTVKVMHSVRPRDDGKRTAPGVRGGAFESHYTFPNDNYHSGESGYFEFPFIRYAWNNSGNSPYCEGPVAFAIGELRSLQEMAKNELIASQQMIRPAFATFGKNFTKVNLNPGATNPGLISPEGQMLIQPISGGTRPDFAQSIIESRRNNVREMLYLNLWQIIVQEKGGDDTATAALIRAQEKGELLGPTGISMNEGLSMMTDREIAILGRKRAFDDDSPLAMPDSMGDREVTPTFTSPLDRLRRMSELVGMQRLVEFATMLAGGDPQRGAQMLARLDADEMLEKAQEILGAPVGSLKPREESQAADEQAGQQNELMQALAALKGGGDAAQAVGAGAGQLAQGMEQARQSPGLENAMGNMSDIMAAGQAGAANAARGM